MGSYYIKVNKSLLESGKITISREEINSLIDVIGWSVGDSREVNLELDNKFYVGKIAYKDRNAKGTNSKPYYQLSYGQELNKNLKKLFIHTFLAIEDEKIAYNKTNRYHITSNNFNRKVLQLKTKNENTIIFIPFLKIQTEYDNIFEMMIETNMLGIDEINEKERNDDFIAYSSSWIPIEKLSEHKNVINAVYYLADTINKEIYIGVCDNLGARVKSRRKEIPNWNFF
ncbi:MAG TPA: hypothetical protein VEF53_11210, partial [Patescibacteria group bacterium]|nr:hypothetical protein [Patescibacteria group bacterium]